MKWEKIGPGIYLTHVEWVPVSITISVYNSSISYNVYTKGWKIGTYQSVEEAKEGVVAFFKTFQFKE